MEKKHIADIIWSRLSAAPGSKPAGGNEKKVSELKKKVFISDWEARKLYNKEKNEIAVPSNAMLSPLSLDWIEYQNVGIVRK